jgi:hypothetical protein
VRNHPQGSISAQTAREGITILTAADSFVIGDRSVLYRAARE